MAVIGTLSSVHCHWCTVIGAWLLENRSATPGQAYNSGSLTYCQPVVQGTVAHCVNHKHIATIEKSPCNRLMGKRPCKQAGKSCEHKVETIKFKRNGANKAIDTLTNALSYSSVPAVLRNEV